MNQAKFRLGRTLLDDLYRLGRPNDPEGPSGPNDQNEMGGPKDMNGLCGPDKPNKSDEPDDLNGPSWPEDLIGQVCLMIQTGQVGRWTLILGIPKFS